MKSFLSLSFLFWILSGSSSTLAFQQHVPLRAPSASLPLPFHRQQVAETSSFRRNDVLLASTIITMDTATAEAAPSVATINPWERVCTTVSTTTSHLNALRQKIAKSGVATALSYSLVSNAFTSVAVSLAWYGFSLQTGLSPISPGQWKPFLALYGGFYAVNSLLKPVRFMLAYGVVVPHTERVMAAFRSRFSDSKKAAIACSTALLVAVSATMMASGIGMASLASGVPIFPVA